MTSHQQANDGPMPTLFLSHGSPMIALEPGAAGGPGGGPVAPQRRMPPCRSCRTLFRSPIYEVLPAAEDAAQPSAQRRGRSKWPLNRPPQILRKIKQTHEAKRLRLFFQDEARIGQKNKITRRWAKRGTRPNAPRDQRTASTYIFGAICPRGAKGAALVLPRYDTVQ